MPASEIDDIFGGKSVNTSSKAKGKTKSIDEPVTPSTATPSRKKKSKKRQRQHGEGSEEPDGNPVLSKVEPKRNGDGRGVTVDGDKSPKAKRSRIVETVADPSAAVPSTPSRPEIPPKSQPKMKTKTKTKTSTGEKVDNAMERFKDSRGTGPRRRTDEGFQIFKENELGIRDDGGDTPLCPFDCNCCF